MRFPLSFAPIALAALLIAAAIGLSACSAEPQARGLPMASLSGPDAPPLTSLAGHSHAADAPPHGPGPGPGPGDGRAGSDAQAAPSVPPAVDLVISEVMTDPLLVADVVGEYVEVIYLGAEPASLDGVSLILPDGRSVPLVGVAPASKPRGRSAARRKKRHGVQPPAETRPNVIVQPGDVVVVRSTRSQRLRLPNRAGRLELRRSGVGLEHAVVLDVAQWAGRWPWPRHKAGKALCRVAPDRDGSLGRAWRRCRTKLRGVERGSPGVVAAACVWLKSRNVQADRCVRLARGPLRSRLASTTAVAGSRLRGGRDAP